MIKPITQEALREIVPDFAKAIREKKAKNVKPATAVINFRDEKLKGHERSIESVPIDLLRYRKDNGRIASDVMNYQQVNGPLDEKDESAQKLLRGFLHDKHPEMTEILIKSIEHIYGGTPSESTVETDELTREKIIREFKNSSSGLDVLIANPAACAESISLHTACSHAIYYDLSYNCAQYLQSLDRIHRVGGSEDKISHYHFLQYEGTLDEDILRTLRRKADNMSAVIDQECPVYALDMFSEEDELAAYERLFR